MQTRTTVIVLVVITLLALVASAYYYPALPDQVVTHWDANGVANGYSGKFVGAFLVPILMLVLMGVYFLIPAIDPLRKNIESFRPYYNLLWAAILGFMLYVQLLSLAFNTGRSIDISRAMLPGLAVLFWLVGVVIEHSKRSWFVGIRTPWTLSDDVVWERTHELGGKLFRIAAVFTLIGLVANAAQSVWFVLVPVLGAALITIVYSYVIYRQRHA